MLPKTKEFLHKEITIGSSFIDFTGKLSIQSLFSFFQEVAWEHATLNGFGFEHLKEQGYFWALSRIKVEITEMPKWTDQITLSTWPSGTEGPFALRDFSIFNSQGEKIIGATSSWLIVDTASRRPRRPDAFKERMPICENVRATEGNAPKITQDFSQSTHSYSVMSCISDIDVNGHINNTKYLEWAINSFSVKEFEQFSMESIVTNYLAEGFCEDQIEIKRGYNGEKSFICSINSIANNKILALIEFKMK